MKSQAESKRFLFISIMAILFGLSLFWQYSTEPILLSNAVPNDFIKAFTLILLFLLSVIFELLRIKFYNSIITIQVMVSLSVLFLFGKDTAIFFVLIYYLIPLLNRKYKAMINVYNSFLKYAHHAILIIILSNLFYYLLPVINNKYLDLVLIAILYKLLNYIIIDWIWLNKLEVNKAAQENILRVLMIETWIYLSSIPLVAILAQIFTEKNENVQIIQLISIFYFITIITFFIKSYSVKTDLYEKLKYELQKNKSISTKLKKMLQSIKRFEVLNEDYETFSRFIAEDIAHIFEYNYVLINKFDYQNDKIQRIASYGMSEEDFKNLQNNPPPISFYNIFAKDENRVSNSYFFSANQFENEKYIYYTPIQTEYEQNEKKWTKDDTLVIPIGTIEEPIGYVSLDQPQNGRLPSIETLRLLEVFVQNISYHFSLIEKINKLNEESLRDPITSLYGIRYLKKLKNKFSKLVLIDIKDFKNISSKFGLEKSDVILQELAKIIKRYTRKQDIVIRYIGDWFLILSNSDYENLRSQLRTISILASKIIVEQEKVKVVLQFGIIDVTDEDIMKSIFKAQSQLTSFNQI